MAIDYSNLPKQAEEARATQAFKGKPLEEGEFKAIILGGELTETNAAPKRDMFKIKVQFHAPDSPRMHKEQRDIRFIVSKTTMHQFDNFLILMADLGVDLSKVKRSRDWNEVFNDIEDAAEKKSTTCRALIEVYYSDKDRDEDEETGIKKGAYANFVIKEILQGLNADAADNADAEEEDAAAAKKAAAAEKRKAAKAKKEAAAAAAAEKAAEEEAEEPAAGEDADAAEDTPADDAAEDDDDDWD